MAHHEVPRSLEIATTAVIAVNVGSAVWGHFGPEGHHEAAELVENATLVFFAAEIALRLRLQGWRDFSRDRWNVFDAVVVVLAALPMIADSLVGLRAVSGLVRVARALHMLRHAAHFRLVTRYKIWQLKRRFTPVGEGVEMVW